MAYKDERVKITVDVRKDTKYLLQNVAAAYGLSSVNQLLKYLVYRELALVPEGTPHSGAGLQAWLEGK